ncbi:hypothetical protein WJX75_007426 [Coccomyxa subellipsoidea]|uniref:GST N-terminal domain-containing protein n=1 Tax=Coccomyxa subellipsoidea TaxID=248742 RepID=A0ABR2YE90_9CHLO
MKAKAGKLFSRERVTAPVLLKPDGNIYESFEIAQWADGHSKRPEAANLFPSGKLGDIKRWDDASNEISSYGRKVALDAALGNEKARLFLVPPALLRLPGGRSIGLAISGRVVKGMQRKYKDLDSQVTMEKALEHRGGWSTLWLV